MTHYVGTVGQNLSNRPRATDIETYMSNETDRKADQIRTNEIKMFQLQLSPAAEIER